MTNVVFEEDPIYTSYLDEQQKIFEKPSSSPIINGLIEKGVIHSERNGGFVVFLILALLMCGVIYLFFKHVIFIQGIDTHQNFVPAVAMGHYYFFG
jgi:hypothetical protein